jgi:hypothetical protein
MSVSVSTAFIRQYEREVHLAYQRKGSLIRGTIRTQNGVQGESTTFQIIGSGTAGDKTRHGEVPVMNLVHTNVTATLIDKYAADYIDKLDLMKLNIDERAAIVESGARALGRATDQIIIDAMDDATNTTAITVTSGATIRNSILTATTALRARDVDWDGNVHGLISPMMDAQLMCVPEYKDADFIGDDLPYKAMGWKPRTWLGVHWICHTGLPLSTNTRTGFIYHRSAVGHAIGSDVQSMIDWVPEKAAWFANSMMSMGAVLIDNNGVQELTMDESSALATT